VAVEGDRITVTFYTFSGLERQTIYRQRDTYVAGNYDYESETKPIALGPGGFLFGDSF
jgi:hypothetical protein